MKVTCKIINSPKLIHIQFNKLCILRRKIIIFLICRRLFLFSLFFVWETIQDNTYKTEVRKVSKVGNLSGRPLQILALGGHVPPKGGVPKAGGGD